MDGQPANSQSTHFLIFVGVVGILVLSTLICQVMALRSVVLKGLPILLGDDSRDVYKTCFDTAKEEALASVTIGVLTVQQQGLA